MVRTMRKAWRKLQRARFWIRIPVKAGLFAAITFAVLFPHPVLFARHIQHLRHIDALTDPRDPATESVSREFDAYLSREHVDAQDTAALLRAVERFVYARVPYAYDWDNWGLADYLPSVSDILAQGREDCDGRAVLAVALLRGRGIQAELVGDPRHVWVRTPQGEAMNPLGPAVFSHDSAGTHVRWAELIDIGPFAFGVSVFPISRELIILLTVWLLILPLSMPRGAAMILGWLLLEALVILRVAGANPVAPHYGGIAWSGLHLLAAGWFVLRFRQNQVQYRPVGI